MRDAPVLTIHCLEKTTIAGRIKHEVSCTPLPNAETDHLLQVRAMEAMKPKAQTTILGSLPYGPDGIIHAGTQRAHEAFEGFIVREFWTFDDGIRTRVHAYNLCIRIVC